MLKILNLRNGAVLNRHDGNESENFLEVVVEGVCERHGKVLVNGAPASTDNLLFKAPVRLTEKFNEITAETTNSHGVFRQTVKVIWDKKSFKRYNFFIDDNVFFLTDIAKENPGSLFDHFYLKSLREIHRKHGTKFTLNLFYRNDHSHFEIKDFPDKYKSEWRDNAAWLRLSFHALSEFPDRPYQNAAPEKLAHDYDLLKSEIVRFAGEEAFQVPVVIHWAMTPPDCVKVLKARGVNTLSGQFVDAQTYVGETGRGQPITDIGYYLDLDKSLYLKERHVMYDFDHDMLFTKCDVCCNLCDKKTVETKLRAALESPRPRDTIGLATHEQYSFKYYKNFIPDHAERMELAARLASENGHKPVFFADGILGNDSWE